MRPGHLVGGQQGERLFQGGDRLVLPAHVPQGARAPVQHQRAPDRVVFGREPGQGLVEQRQGAVDGARLVGGLAGQDGDLRLVQAGALLRVGDPGPDLQRPLQVALGLGRGERGERVPGRGDRGGQRAGQVEGGVPVVGQGGGHRGACLGQLRAGQARVAGERLAVGGVQAAPLPGEHVLVDRVPGERVPEGVAPAGVIDHEQVALDGFAQSGVEFRVADSGHLG